MIKGMKRSRALKWLLVSLVAWISVLSLQAAPLSNIPQQIKQPDGSIIDCFASGDEFFNYLHDEAGHIIIQDQETGYYTYAIYKGNELISSKYIVGKKRVSLSEIKGQGIELAEQAQLKLPDDYEAKVRNSQITVGNKAPSKGRVEGIVVFVRFSNEDEFIQHFNQFKHYFLGTTDVSLNGYFKEVSNNQLDFNTVFYPTSEEGAYSYTDVFPREYYMPYSKWDNPIGYKGGGNSKERYKREKGLFDRILKKVNGTIPNYLNLDQDEDGEVDSVTFIVCGSTTGWNDILWPHYLSSTEPFAALGGKDVNRVVVQLADILTGEDNTAQGGVGVLAHEAFHVLGAPDLYRYNYSGNPVGPWDLMAEQDANAPQHMTTYMKMKYGKWIDDIPTITESGTYTLDSVYSNSGNAFRIPSSDSNQYYVVEYRKKQGRYEKNIPSEGLLVYRIDTSVEEGNGNGPPDEVYVYRPQNSGEEKQDILVAPLSQQNGHTSLGTREMYLQYGEAGNVCITNVHQVGSKVAFNVQLGAIAEPEISEESCQFYGTLAVTMKASSSDLQIYYTLDGSEPNENSISYIPGETVYIKDTTHLKAIAYKEGEYSTVTSRNYVHVDYIQSSHPYTYKGKMEEWVISIPGAESIAITFDERMDYDSGVDIYDKEEFVDWYWGSQLLELKDRTLIVQGDYVKLIFEEAYDTNIWGYGTTYIQGISSTIEGWKVEGDEFAYYKEGVRLKGWVEINGYLRYFEPDTGFLARGWTQVGIYNRYFTIDGVLLTNAWFYDEGGLMFLNEHGTPVKGWYSVKGQPIRYFDSQGYLLTNVISPDGRPVDGDGFIIE